MDRITPPPTGSAAPLMAEVQVHRLVSFEAKKKIA
jgi:hypothetical protein